MKYVYKKVAITTLLVLPLLSIEARAGYLDFSPNWSAPATVPMTKRKAVNIVSRCNSVSAYANKSGENTGAMVVAGPHQTKTDHVTHLTVRLYKQGRHEKTCHVHINDKRQYQDCSCNWL